MNDLMKNNTDIIWKPMLRVVPTPEVPGDPYVTLIRSIEQHAEIKKLLYVGLVLGEPRFLIALCEKKATDSEQNVAYFINCVEATPHSSFLAAKSAARRFAKRYI